MDGRMDENLIAHSTLLMIANMSTQLEKGDFKGAYRTASRIVLAASEYVQPDNWASVACSVAEDAIQYIRKLRPDIAAIH